MEQLIVFDAKSPANDDLTNFPKYIKAQTENLKKYANRRFFDTATKKYIKPEKLAELIKKGEKIHVTLTKTGKDITDTVIGQFSKKGE